MQEEEFAYDDMEAEKDFDSDEDEFDFAESEDGACRARRSQQAVSLSR